MAAVRECILVSVAIGTATIIIVITGIETSVLGLRRVARPRPSQKHASSLSKTPASHRRRGAATIKQTPIFARRAPPGAFVERIDLEMLRGNLFNAKAACVVRCFEMVRYTKIFVPALPRRFRHTFEPSPRTILHGPAQDLLSIISVRPQPHINRLSAYT